MNKKELEIKNQVIEPELSDDLLELVEVMAENVHKEWMNLRLSQGWIFGESRNDDLKTHPCLIDYEKLTEDEKEYDRMTAIQTLKLILKLGYKIEKDSQG